MESVDLASALLRQGSQIIPTTFDGESAFKHVPSKASKESAFKHVPRKANKIASRDNSRDSTPMRNGSSWLDKRPVLEVPDDDDWQGLQPQLGRLRTLIRQDMQELLHAELQPSANGSLGDEVNASRVPVSFLAPITPDVVKATAFEEVEAPFVPDVPLGADAEPETEELLFKHYEPGIDPWKAKEALHNLKKVSGLDKIDKTAAQFQRPDFEEPDHPVVLMLRDAVDGMPCAMRWIEWFNDLLRLKQPKPEGCCADVVQGRPFEIFFSLVILLNAVFMVVQMNHEVQHPGAPPLPVTLLVDRFCLVCYTVELLLKLVVYKWYFFWNQDMHWNILDFSLVMYSYFDVIMAWLAGNSGALKAAWMRSFRLFRIAKVLRILRVVKSLEQLQLILNCIMGSFMSLIWSILMLFVMFYMFSLILVQQAGMYLADHEGGEQDDIDHNDAIKEYFGSVQTCMRTLFLATFNGDWLRYLQALEGISFLATFMWFFFVLFTNVALLNILTGIFVERALELALGDAQVQAAKVEEKRVEEAKELAKLCNAWDTTGKSGEKDGHMSRREFEEMAESEDFSRYLRFIGMDINNIRLFFELISGSNESVDIPTFVAGCMQLRGFSKTSDLLYLMYEVEKMATTLGEIHQDLDAKIDRIHKDFKSQHALAPGVSDRT